MSDVKYTVDDSVLYKEPELTNTQDSRVERSEHIAVNSVNTRVLFNAYPFCLTINILIRLKT